MYCSDLIWYCCGLYYNAKEYSSLVDEVDGILEKGRVKLNQRDSIDFSFLKKSLKREDTSEEELLWLRFYEEAEDEDGKKSLRYLLKKML